MTVQRRGGMAAAAEWRITLGPPLRWPPALPQTVRWTIPALRQAPEDDLLRRLREAGL